MPPEKIDRLQHLNPLQFDSFNVIPGRYPCQVFFHTFYFCFICERHQPRNYCKKRVRCSRVTISRPLLSIAFCRQLFQNLTNGPPEDRFTIRSKRGIIHIPNQGDSYDMYKLRITKQGRREILRGLRQTSCPGRCHEYTKLQPRSQHRNAQIQLRSSRSLT